MSIPFALALLLSSGTDRSCDQLLNDVVRLSTRGDRATAAVLERAFVLQCHSRSSHRQEIEYTPDERSPDGAWWCRKPTSPFGFRRDPFSGKKRFHQGTDVPARMAETIRSPFNEEATVLDAGWRGGLGLAVTIVSRGVQLQVAHCSALLVETGTVQPNQPLCRAGSTGRSTNPHVHAATTVDGQLKDPLPYLRKWCEAG